MPYRTELKEKMKYIFKDAKKALLATIKLAEVTKNPDYNKFNPISWDLIGEAKAKIMLSKLKKADKACKGKGKECKFYENGCKLIGICLFEGEKDGNSKR